MNEFNTRKITREDLGEFVGQMIDIFEDFLEARGIDLANDEKNEGGEDSIAIIYGSDYDELAVAIEATLASWGLAEGLE